MSRRTRPKTRLAPLSRPFVGVQILPGVAMLLANRGADTYAHVAFDGAVAIVDPSRSTQFVREKDAEFAFRAAADLQEQFADPRASMFAALGGAW